MSTSPRRRIAAATLAAMAMSTLAAPAAMAEDTGSAWSTENESPFVDNFVGRVGQVGLYQTPVVTAREFLPITHTSLPEGFSVVPVVDAEYDVMVDGDQVAGEHSITFDDCGTADPCMTKTLTFTVNEAVNEAPTMVATGFVEHFETDFARDILVLTSNDAEDGLLSEGLAANELPWGFGFANEGEGQVRVFVDGTQAAGEVQLTATMCDSGGRCVENTYTFFVNAAPTVDLTMGAVAFSEHFIGTVGTVVVADTEPGELDLTLTNFSAGLSLNMVEPGTYAILADGNQTPGNGTFRIEACDWRDTCDTVDHSFIFVVGWLPTVTDNVQTTFSAVASGSLGHINPTDVDDDAVLPLTLDFPVAGLTLSTSYTDGLGYELTADGTQSGFVALHMLTVDSDGNRTSHVIDFDFVADFTGADTEHVARNTPSTINVLFNDGTHRSVALTSVTDPANGTAEIIDGLVLYTPTNDFVGPDTFNYTVCVEQGAVCFEQTVTATVVAVPVNFSVDDTVTTTPGTPVVINMYGNDNLTGLTNVYGSVIDSPANGTLNVGANAAKVAFKPLGSAPQFLRAEYTPNDGFVGTDTFSYEVCGQFLPVGNVCSTSTVTVNVGAPFVAPLPRLAEPTVVALGTLIDDAVAKGCGLSTPMPAGLATGARLERLRCAKGAGRVLGTAEDTFKAEAPLTRAQFATILARAAKRAGLAATGAHAGFGDVTGTHAPGIRFLADHRAVFGDTTGAFNPNGKVTGRQIVAMLTRLLGVTEAQLPAGLGGKKAITRAEAADLALLAVIKLRNDCVALDEGKLVIEDKCDVQI